MKDSVIIIRADKKLKKELNKISKQTKIKLSEVVRVALASYVKEFVIKE